MIPQNPGQLIGFSFDGANLNVFLQGGLAGSVPLNSVDSGLPFAPESAMCFVPESELMFA